MRFFCSHKVSPVTTRRTCRTLVQSHLHTLVHIYLCIIFWLEERKVVKNKRKTKNQSRRERASQMSSHLMPNFKAVFQKIQTSCFQVRHLPKKKPTTKNHQHPTDLDVVAKSWGCFQTTFSADRHLLSRSLVCGFQLSVKHSPRPMCGKIIFFSRLLSSTSNTVFVASLFRVLFAVHFVFCVCDKVHI